ncbi:hypothetical protein L6452_16671 [Arctium lappa]|uniref:Uncharacterized protein n=1 Tax=Arctium lappa TaxID=4217 RepID=A0ACB9C154_ARCLA|nr:hypothetical protein L6452_16671 [Arctium lappa]
MSRRRGSVHGWSQGYGAVVRDAEEEAVDMYMDEENNSPTIVTEICRRCNVKDVTQISRRICNAEDVTQISPVYYDPDLVGALEAVSRRNPDCNSDEVYHNVIFR